MKTVKTFLMAATALSMTAGVALADDNKAFSEQVSSSANGSNSALVTQSGSTNQAGATGNAMLQSNQGSKVGNNLDILQSGDNNEIGVVDLSQLTQNGNSDGNSADLTQKSSGNVVGKVDQRDRFGGAPNAPGNILTIVQGAANDGLSDGNTINTVTQDKHKGTGNTANVSMSGANNTINKITQVSTGGEGVNTLDVDISGSNNGNGTLSGFAASSGATSSELLQGYADVNGGNADKGGNSANLVISGNGNQFGVTQEFFDNSVGTLTIAGDNNQLGVAQVGNTNTVSIATIAGDGNDIGVEQLGTTNTASVSVLQDNNAFGVLQNGSTNDADVSVDGNGNGSTSTTPTLSGDALTAAGASLVQAGLVEQQGNDNVVTASFTGDNNLFGMLQDGNGNNLSGTVAGSQNQVIVAQVGNGNLASFTQQGNGNNLGINQ